MPEERLWFISLNGLAVASRLGAGPTRRWLSDQFIARRGRDYDPWAYDQIQQHDWTRVFEAGRELGRFSSVSWASSIDVPTAVIMTTRDRVVPPRRQQRLVESIPGAKAFLVDGDHDACVDRADEFVPDPRGGLHLGGRGGSPGGGLLARGGRAGSRPAGRRCRRGLTGGLARSQTASIASISAPVPPDTTFTSRWSSRMAEHSRRSGVTMAAVRTRMRPGCWLGRPNQESGSSGGNAQPWTTRAMAGVSSASIATVSRRW